MEEEKKKIAGGARYAQATLARDYTQEVINLNNAIDKIKAERAAAEEDISWWDSVGSLAGAVIGGFIGAAGGPAGMVAGARIGYGIGGAGGSMAADHFIEGDEATLYDEINPRDFKFDLDTIRQYEADFQRMNVEDEIRDRDRLVGTGVDALTTMVTSELLPTDWLGGSEGVSGVTDSYFSVGQAYEPSSGLIRNTLFE
jgi:hypothetical protein